MISRNLSDSFLQKLSNGPAAAHWQRIGLHKRAGVAVPLFSLHSQNSTGIGDASDLRLLVDWCRQCGLSIIQLLPLNDVGFNFRPYDAQSTFALDPMYLALSEITGIAPAVFSERIQALRQQFLPMRLRVQYGIKQAKLDLLRDMYASKSWTEDDDFSRFRQANAYWLSDYALFRVIKQVLAQKNWEAWPAELKNRHPEALQALALKNAGDIRFQEWLQWQTALQFQKIKTYAQAQDVLLMGDLPFLVSRDSADVWSNQGYFKLDLAAGAPPDAYQANGQRWGMPPYNWGAIDSHEYDYLTRKLQCAEQFYHLYRIDHFVGIFRLWTIPLSEPDESGGRHGSFDPKDDWMWEAHGRKLLDVMLKSSTMLPCAEDLGTVPACSYKLLDEYGIVGMDIQRWYRDWNHSFTFKSPETYRSNSMAVISTHDMSILQAWWENEAGTVDELFFRNLCRNRGLDAGNLIPQLFDPGKSRHERLYWRRDIDSVDKLTWILGRPAGELKDFIDAYNSSFHEQAFFWSYLGLPGQWEPGFSPRLAWQALELINRSESIFSVQLLMDWLSPAPYLQKVDSWDWRINFPGTTTDENWSVVMPFTLEQMLAFPENPTLLALNKKTGRR